MSWVFGDDDIAIESYKGAGDYIGRGNPSGFFVMRNTTYAQLSLMWVYLPKTCFNMLPFRSAVYLTMHAVRLDPMLFSTKDHVHIVLRKL